MSRRLAFSTPIPSSHHLETAFRQCPEHGFDGVLLQPVQYERFLGDPAGFLGRWGEWSRRAAGMIVRAAVDSEQGRRRVDAVVDLAVGIDGDLVVLAAEGLPLASDAGRAASVLAHLAGLAETARAKGLRLSMRHGRGLLLDTRADLDRLYAAPTGGGGTGLPLAEGLPELTLDVAHLALRSESDAVSVLRDFAGRIDNIHLRDIARSRFPMLEDHRTEFRPLGEGDIDFEPIFDSLKTIGYDGWLTVEDQSATPDPLATMAHAAAFLRRIGA
jgi:sugar phosphate isomerase/epimerase